MTLNHDEVRESMARFRVAGGTSARDVEIIAEVCEQWLADRTAVWDGNALRTRSGRVLFKVHGTDETACVTRGPYIASFFYSLIDAKSWCEQEAEAEGMEVMR